MNTTMMRGWFFGVVLVSNALGATLENVEDAGFSDEESDLLAGVSLAPAEQESQLEASSTAPAHFDEIVDEIVATLYAPPVSSGPSSKTELNDISPIIILRSDTQRLTLDGRPLSLRDLIFTELVIMDAATLHITVSDADLDRFMAALMAQHGLSRLALAEMFTEVGYSYEEAREQLRRQQICQEVYGYRVRTSRDLVIEEDAILAYYDAHPVYTDPSFMLQQAVVAVENMSRAEIDACIAKGALDTLPWQEAFEVSLAQLPDDKKAVLTAQVGSVIHIDQDDQHVEITRLVARTEKMVVPLANRRDEIINILRKERMDGVLKTYHKTLLENAKIKFENPSDRRAILDS